MIKGLWENVTPCCAKHLPEKVPMVFDPQSRDLSYKCSVDGCKESVSAVDFEKALNEISKIAKNRDLNGIWGSLEGETFRVAKKYKCKILSESSDGKYEVSFENIFVKG